MPLPEKGPREHLTVTHVLPLPRHRLLLRFSNGEVRVWNAADLIAPGTVFERLSDPEEFAKVQAHAACGTAAWGECGSPDELDLCVDTLYEESRPAMARGTGDIWPAQRRARVVARHIAALRQAAERFGRPLSTHEWEVNHLRPTVAAVLRQFGTWREAWEAAGFAYEDKRHAALESARRQRLDDMLAVLRQVADRLGYFPSQSQFRAATGRTIAPYVYFFGSWAEACRRTGFSAAHRRVVSSPRVRSFVELAASSSLDGLPPNCRAVAEELLQGRTLKDVGERLGVTRERARQIMEKARRCLLTVPGSVETVDR
jgi:hypothetical protein